MANQAPSSPTPSVPPYSFPPSASSSSSAPFRQKASSDDLKYIQKYKDLKQKVKDIELDNDKLHIKVLKTKKNIQRLRIERAIIYERLSAMPPPIEASSQSSQRQQEAPRPSYPSYPVYSPDPQLHVARRQPDPQDLPQPVFPLDVHPPIHTDKERHLLDAPQRPYPGTEAHPLQPDPQFSHARPLSPTRLHRRPEPYPLPPHMPMDVDRQPSRARHHPQTAQPHPGPSREGDRSVPLPASLPPPPNMLGLPPPYPGVHHAPSMTHSPHFERDERVHGPPDAAYSQYPTRGRERDHERAQLNGPGLPPMRTHPDVHMRSPRATSSPSHNGYAHPLPHPFSASDERNWGREREHERDHPSYAMRDRERDRDRDRRDVQHEPGASNGYRDAAGPPARRHEAPPAHGNGSAQGSPSTPYLASRRASLGQARADSASGRGQERETYERRPAYEYARRPERDGPEGGGGGNGGGNGGEGGRGGQVYEHGKRRNVAEVEGERAREHRGVQKSRRPSQDGADERRQGRRERDAKGAGMEKDMVPRVREGELME